jgi:hypothetical protein
MVAAALAVTACTLNVWLPPPRVTDEGELQGCHAPPSTEHELEAPGSLTVQANVEVGEVDVAGGVDVNLRLRLLVAGGGEGGGG